MTNAIFCKRCGARNPREGRFCAQCGASLRESDATTPAPTRSETPGVSAPPAAAAPAPPTPSAAPTPPPPAAEPAMPAGWLLQDSDEETAATAAAAAAGEKTAPPAPVPAQPPARGTDTLDLKPVPRATAAPPPTPAAPAEDTAQMPNPAPPPAPPPQATIPFAKPAAPAPPPTPPTAAATPARPAGAAMPDAGAGAIFCRHCGAKNLRDSQFCDQCSMPLYAPGPQPGGAAAIMPGYLASSSRPSAPPPAAASAAPSAPMASAPVPAPPMAGPGPAAAPAPSAPVGPAAAPPPGAPPSEALRARVGPAGPVPPAGATAAPVVPAAPTTPAAKGAAPIAAKTKAKRRGPPWLLIAGVIVLLAIFIGVGFSGILGGLSSGDLQSSIGTAVAQQATVQSQQGDQIRLALTQLANSGGSQDAQQTAIVQATAASVNAQATATAVIAQVATIAVEKQSANGNKGPAGEQIVVVPVVFPPAPDRTFLTPVPLPDAQQFTGQPGADADHAATISIPMTVTGQLANADATHWYKVDLTHFNGGALVVTLSAPKTADGTTNVTLFDAAGVNRQDTIYVKPATSDQIVFSADPAVYTIEVDGAASGSGSYTLSVTDHPNAANKDKNTALPLSLVGSLEAFKDSEDDVHWYAVDMSKYPAGGQFVAALTVPASSKNEYDLFLMDASGANQVDVKYVRPGQNDQVQDEQNTATKYFVVVKGSGYAWDAPYTISTYFLPHSASGTPDQALNVTLPFQAKVRIAAPEDVVYLRFQVTATTRPTVKIQMPADGNSVAVQFTDSVGHENYGYVEVAPGQQNTMDGYLPNPGTYLLKVQGRSGTSLGKNPVILDVSVKPTHAP